MAIEAGLRVVGHEVEQISLPYLDDLAFAPKQLMAFRLMQMTDWCDHLIALGAPVHVLDHPSKVIWCQNEPRSLRGGGLTRPDHRPVWLRSADAVGFGQALAVYATTLDRISELQTYGIACGLLPPLEDAMSGSLTPKPAPADVLTALLPA